jgi:serine protease Do
VISVVDPSRRTRAQKGLQRGDIVLSANYTDVKTVAELWKTRLRAAKAKAARRCCCASSAAASPAAYLPVRTALTSRAAAPTRASVPAGAEALFMAGVQ